MVWFRVNDIVADLEFSDGGLLGIASHNGYAYILDQTGRVLSTIRGKREMNGVSYCCDRFGFINWDENVYIYDLSISTWRKVRVANDNEFYTQIVVTRDGFLVGGEKFAYFDFNGNLIWKVKIGNFFVYKPRVHDNYVYIPISKYPHSFTGMLTILDISSGKEIRSIEFEDIVKSIGICDRYLAVGTSRHVYLYDVTDPKNPKEMFRFDDIATGCSSRKVDCSGAISLAFAPNCNHLAIIDGFDRKVIFLNMLYWRSSAFSDLAAGPIAWWNRRIAIGSFDVYMFEIPEIIDIKIV